MTRVLLTGASGFIATHVLDVLLAHNHSVRITVRSADKAKKLLAAHQSAASAGTLDYAIVPDIAQPGAFDDAVKDSTGFEAIIHTASPFHFNVTDPKRDLLDPAIQGTLSVLQAAHAFAPTVKRIIITSSFAAMIDPTKGIWPGHTYTSSDWSPISLADATSDAGTAYRASKKFAEKAGWDFVAEKKPAFDIATINPPYVFGPVKPYIHSLESVNTSNMMLRNMLRGDFKESGLPESGIYIWTDVRDVAEAHVAAMEKPEAGGKRFFVVEGNWSIPRMASVVRGYKEYAGKLPEKGESESAAKGWGVPEGYFGVDNGPSREVLGLRYRGFEECVRDTVESFKELGA